MAKTLAPKAQNMIALADLIPSPENPRIIKDEGYKRLKEKIKKRPHFLKYLPIIYDAAGIIRSGNQRHQILKDLGYKEIPEEWTRKAEELSEEEIQELVLWANQHEGEYDFEMLANFFPQEMVKDAGIFIPNLTDFSQANPDELSTDFSLKDGEKPPFRTMSFTFANEQAIQIENAIEDARADPEFEFYEFYENENNPGNALFFIIEKWKQLQQKK